MTTQKAFYSGKGSLFFRDPVAGERERERGGCVLPRIPLTLRAGDRFMKSNPKKSDEKRQRRRAARARAATPFCVHVWPGRTAGIRRSRGWFDTIDKKLTTKSVLCCLSHLLARTALVPQACPLICASPPPGLRHSQCLGCVWLQGVVRRLGHSDETGSGSRRAADEAGLGTWPRPGRRCAWYIVYVTVETVGRALVFHEGISWDASPSQSSGASSASS